MELDKKLTWMSPRQLQVASPFSDLFPIRKDIRERITGSMNIGGFDESKPINVWSRGNLVIDGHTRRLAAIDANIQVLVCFHDFKDEDEALDYAIANQRDRRNLTDAELASLVLAVDRRKARGGDRRSEEAKSKPSSDGIDSCASSANHTAALTGTSATKVEKVRRIKDHAQATGDPSELNAVLDGTKSINQAARAVSDKKRKEEEDRLRRVREYFTANPRASQNDGIRDLGMSNGTLWKCREKLGLTGRAKSHAAKGPEKGKGTCGSVPLVPRHSVPLNVKMSIPGLSPEDEAWLSRLTVRSALSTTSKFDADALIVRHCKPALQGIKEKIASLIGPRSVSGMTPLHRVLHRLFDLANPETWLVCTKCKGSASDESGRCARCDGLGYVIPNFTKDLTKGMDK